MRVRPRLLRQLDAFGHSRAVRCVHEEQLVQAEAQRGKHRRVELLERAPGERLQHPVERRLHLDGSVREPHRESAIARRELCAAGLTPKRAIRVRALLEDAPHDLVRATASGCRAHRVTARLGTWCPRR